MKLISVILNELIDLESAYEFEKVQDVTHKGIGRVLIYKFCTEGEVKDDEVKDDEVKDDEVKKDNFQNCDGFVYKVELKEDMKTKGIYPPIFELSFNVPTVTVDDKDQLRTKAAKGDVGNRSYEILTGQHDTRVFPTVVKIAKDFIKIADGDYSEKDGGYAITWEGTFGDEYGYNAGQDQKDARERIYKSAVNKFKGDHSNLIVVDEIKSPTGRIQLRFNGWSPAEQDNI